MMAGNNNKDIWVYIDLRNQRLFGLCLNVLAGARALAASLSGRAAAIIPMSSQGFINSEEAAETCTSKGADRVYLLENPALEFIRADVHALALLKAIEKMPPKAVLFTLTDFCREIAARCARRRGAGLIADCAELHVEDMEIVTGCPSWGGEIMARLTFSDKDVTGFMTVQPHAFQAVDVRGTPGTVERIRTDDLEVDKRLNRISFSGEQVGRRRLEEAGTVVVGGAGMGNSDGFGLVRELSAALGGEVGATRPPVLNHWVDEERLIGQTGKRVRPELLVSVGTSGAIQYTAGIMESKNIVAINRDPDSPIFHVADLGVVADAKSFLPVFTARVKQAVMRDIADAFVKDSARGEGNGLGDKLQKLRESHDWSVEDLAQRTGQSPEFIQQVETNEVVPSVSFLLSLSKALDVDPGTFLRDEEKAAIQDQRAQAFIRRTKNYYYRTLTPAAENQHLRGFMITIEPMQAHKPVAYKHEGEEFIYVMEGSLELTLDHKLNHLKVGESIHFNSEIPHKLKNSGSETTQCLVVLYTP